MGKRSNVRSFLWSGTAAALFAAVTWTNTASSPVSGRMPARLTDIALPSPMVKGAPEAAHAPRVSGSPHPAPVPSTAVAMNEPEPQQPPNLREQTRRGSGIGEVGGQR